MKKIFIISVLLFFALLLPVFGETVFVTARVCPLQSEASPGSSRTAMLKQGTELSVIEKNGDWIKVKAADGTVGYVQSFFTGAEPSASKVSRSSSLENISSVTQRRRASAYQTSAAATRGLTSDNVRDRENTSFSEYDFTAIKWVEQFSWETDEIIAFASEEGLLF
jgi:uncharacterized protein YgiM (DUF1202 family)